MTKDYYEIVKDILESSEFQKRKGYPHHGSISVYDHSLKVSKIAYKLSKKFKSIDSNSVAIGALLHDMYDKPWGKSSEKKPFFKKHGFTHANEALENAKKLYPNYLNEKVEDIIKKHMFPLNIAPPKYKESWLVSLIDKCVSMEVLTKPEFFLLLLGIRR